MDKKLLILIGGIGVIGGIAFLLLKKKTKLVRMPRTPITKAVEAPKEDKYKKKAEEYLKKFTEKIGIEKLFEKMF